MNKKIEVLIIGVLLLTGAYFRFQNLNWDQGLLFHPDERNIASAVSKIQFFEKLNPEFFAYGGFTIYLIRATADILNFLTQDPNWGYEWGKINLIARTYSATFSLLTLIPLYLLAKNIFGKTTGFIASSFYALCVSSIQTAHFGVTESLLTLQGVLIMYVSIKIYEHPELRRYLILGALLGISAATKTSGLILIIPLVAVFITKAFGKRYFIDQTANLVLSLTLALTLFVVFSPYTFLSWGKFLESMRYESGVVSGTLPVPYTLQFQNTSAYLFQIENFFWQLGPVTLFCLIGYFFMILYFIKSKDKKVLILLILPTIYFLYLGSWYTKFIRYMVPIIPFLLIFASFFITSLKQINVKFFYLIFFFLTCATFFWTIAFSSVYSNPQTRVAASKWIYENIPPGSSIYTEHWDDGLPVPVDGWSPSVYKTTALEIYQPDDEGKLTYYSEKLSSGEYIVINSRRLYGTLTELTEKYPLTSKYYQLLFSEKLGYRKIGEFSSYPQVLGFEINDDSSEETFQVYDHPKVLIFRNEGRFTFSQIEEILR